MLKIDLSIGNIVWIVTLSVLFIYFTNSIFEERVVNKWVKVVSSCLFVIINCVCSICFSNSYYWFSDIVFLLFSLLYLCIFYKSYFVENVVVSLNYYVILDFIVNVFNMIFANFNNNSNISDWITDLLPVISTIIVAYIIVTRVLVKLLCYKDYYFTNYEFGWLIFFGLVGFFSLIFYQGPSFLLVGAISCVSMLLFSSYIQLMRKEEESKEHLVERNHFLEEQDKLIRAKELEKYESYKKSTEADEQIRRIHHDLMHHFNALLSYKNIEEVREYINKLKGVVTSEESTYETGSTILDMLLQEQCIEAENQGIKFKVMGDFSEGLILDPMSVSIIFGNLLKNAMEACMKIDPGNYRAINIRFYQEPKKEIRIHIDNTNYEKPKMKKSGEIVTTKEDEDQLHGIGLKSVKTEVTRYGGIMKVSLTNTLFEVDITIPITPLNAPLEFKEELKNNIN